MCCKTFNIIDIHPEYDIIIVRFKERISSFYFLYFNKEDLLWVKKSPGGK